MSALSPDTIRLIEQTVGLQRSSPDFPIFCVSHVTDKNYQFLFGHGSHSGEREFYKDVISRAQSISEPSRKDPERPFIAGQPALSCEIGVSQASSSPAMHPNGSLKSERLFRPVYTPSWSLSTLSNKNRGSSFFMSLDHVEELWDDLVRSLGPSRDGRPSKVAGPHAPHLFHRRCELQHFVEDVLVSVQEESKDDVESVVLFMLGRLPMTECFMFALSYIGNQMLYYVHDRLLLVNGLSNRIRCRNKPKDSLHVYRSSGRRGRGLSRQRRERIFAISPNPADIEQSDVDCTERPLQRLRHEQLASEEKSDSVSSADTFGATWQRTNASECYRESVRDAMKCLEYAGTILYMVAHTLERHRQREGTLRSAVQKWAREAAPGTGGAALLFARERSSSALASPYYGCVFEKYLLALNRCFVHTMCSCALHHDDGDAQQKTLGNTAKSSSSAAPPAVEGMVAREVLRQSAAYIYVKEMLQLWSCESCWSGAAREEWTLLREQLQRCDADGCSLWTI